MGNEHGKMAGASATPAGIQSMDESLQRKFAKGIQFNMKIVLKGDRNTGKTCLFNRMAGKPFQEAYLPTMEIQVTSILWSYKVTSDTVKVEVWDVVDKGKVQRKQSKGGLKLFNTTPEEEEEEEGEGEREGGKKVLDATFLNVYKGCNGVVLMFDMTKIWTWKYIERELPKVPNDIPVIVLANFRDLGEHRVITKDEIRVFIQSARPEGSSEVMYAESSMKNAFGLMHLHKFLSIPFLQMQQDMLLEQIKGSREQMMAARDELASASSTEDQNYDIETAGQSMVAKDEDLSSAEEEATPPSPPKPASSEPSPVVVKREKPVKPLKSAKEVELTESEEEEEEEEEQAVPQAAEKNRQKDIDLFWEKLGTESAPHTAEENKLKPKAKSGGLLLDWTVPEPVEGSKKKMSAESPAESPSGERKERRKRSSKKGSSSRKKKKESVVGGSSGVNGSGSNAATTSTNDPFGVSSLEAWLNSDILQPTAVTRGAGRSRELGAEAGEEDMGSPATSHKKTKKHRERSSTADNSGSSSRHKKRHRSRQKETD